MLIKDITKPNITSTNAEPLAMHRNETVNITAIITDNIGVNHSWAHIQNSGTANKTMGILSGDMYNVSYKCTEIGNYNVTVYANDSLGNGPTFAIRNFTVDNTNPIIVFNNLDAQNYYNVSFNLNITYVDTSGKLDDANYTIYNLTNASIQTNASTNINSANFAFIDLVNINNYDRFNQKVKPIGWLK